MPFQNPPQLFTRENVEALKPGQMGVYGLYRSNPAGPLWIYVGKGDIRARLDDHLRGDTTCIINEGPTHFVAETHGENASGRERELIQELKPICNARAGI